MHATIYAAFDQITLKLPHAHAVLEVGAIPDAGSLLNLGAFAMSKTRIGISLEYEGRFPNFEIHRQNAHDLSRFSTGQFDAVVCNSMLEHDPEFWQSLSEIHRVCRPGGWIILGVPGYAVVPQNHWVHRMSKQAAKLRWPHTWADWIDGRLASTPTLVVHNHPGDYYRFSEQAVREVFLRGLENTQVEKWMNPPRFIGYGFKPLT